MIHVTYKPYHDMETSPDCRRWIVMNREWRSHHAPFIFYSPCFRAYQSCQPLHFRIRLRASSAASLPPLHPSPTGLISSTSPTALPTSPSSIPPSKTSDSLPLKHQNPSSSSLRLMHPKFKHRSSAAGITACRSEFGAAGTTTKACRTDPRRRAALSWSIWPTSGR